MDKNYDLRKRIMSLVGAAENSDINYSNNYSYIEDIGDGRGYTAGVIGFTTGTNDMVKLVKHYNKLNPNNELKKYQDALTKLSESKSDSHKGLNGFKKAWKNASKNDRDNFIKAQNYVLKTDYMTDAVNRAKEDGLSQLGQYIYFDAIVKHGPGHGATNPKDWSFDDLRNEAKKGAKTPAEGGNEADYLNNFVGKRYDAISAEQRADEDNNPNVYDRLKVQQELIKDSNFDLKLPLKFKMNDENFELTQNIINNFNDQDVDFEHA